LERLIEILPSRAGLEHGRAHVVGAERIAPQRGVNLFTRCEELMLGAAGARIAIATAMPTKKRLSASEASSSQRDEPRLSAAGAN
jgi:hypothetical protein